MRLFIVSLLLCFNVTAQAENKVAIFAGGCFWCMEGPFDKLDGVFSTTSGYTGGITENPTYEETSSGRTGHYEAVQIEYDSSKVSYEKLLEVFWMNVDPFDPGGQFCDKGSQYLSGIFVMNNEERQLASESKLALQEKVKDKAEVATQILAAKTFYPAEDYHQDYYQKNPVRYKYYRFGCGRDKRLKDVSDFIGTAGSG